MTREVHSNTTPAHKYLNLFVSWLNNDFTGNIGVRREGMLNGMMGLPASKDRYGASYRVNGLVSSTNKWHVKKGRGIVD